MIWRLWSTVDFLAFDCALNSIICRARDLLLQYLLSGLLIQSLPLHETTEQEQRRVDRCLERNDQHSNDHCKTSLPTPATPSDDSSPVTPIPTQQMTSVITIVITRRADIMSCDRGLMLAMTYCEQTSLYTRAWQTGVARARRVLSTTSTRKVSPPIPSLSEGNTEQMFVPV